LRKGRQSFICQLGEICARHKGLWNQEAERYLLENAPEI